MTSKLSDKTLDYRSIFLSSPDLYLVVDPHFIILDASDAHLKATMRKREDIIGHDVFEAFPDNPDDATATGSKNFRASLKRVLETRLPDTMAVQKYDIKRPIEEGGGYVERYWSPINSPVLDENNKVKFIVIRVEDVTEYVMLRNLGAEQIRLTEKMRTRAEKIEMEVFVRAQELQEVNQTLLSVNKELLKKEKEQSVLYKKLEKLSQLKTQFCANISHELRTPLTLILGILEKLLADDALIAYQYDLEVIERNTRFLLRLMNDILDSAKLEAGQLALEYYKLDLAVLVRHVASIFESHAKERQIEFTIETPVKLIAEIDPDKTQRALMNLISNAFKLIPPNGKIRCTLLDNETHAVIIVADNGLGIPVDSRDKIFERFYQEKDPEFRQSDGFGLGLAIVKEFVELQGGSVHVEDAPEGGAQFVIYLPLVAPENTLVNYEYDENAVANDKMLINMASELDFKEKVIEISTAELEKIKDDSPLILIIEDNLDMNQHITQLLTKSYRVINAFDGEEGYEKALLYSPDLILCDIMMPKMSGIQFVHEIRQHDELADTSIIILTSKIDHELCAKLLFMGAQDYISKPFSQPELIARIANLVKQKKNKESIEQKNLELAAENKELEAFSYSVSHDLRSPLSSIIGFSNVLLDAYPLDSQATEYVKHILTSGKRMQELIDDLFSLAIGMKTKIESQSVNLSNLVNAILQSYHELDLNRKVEMVIAEDVIATCDEHLIQIVLNNLLGNAWKYTSKNDHAKIEFGCIEDEKGPIYFIRDNGVGFDQASASKLFYPFSRLHSEKDFAGSGVGLAIVKKIIERHHGRIWVESEVNKGTTLYFTLG
ncbi:MAG: ATP-binding protein [Gammaproteobacteria bacterium]|nr:ATP-binding protein [Gammaproteobacteria bacterium]